MPLWATYLHSRLPKVTLLETPEGESLIVMTAESWIKTEGLLHQWRRGNREVVVRCVNLGTPINKQQQIQHEWPRTLDIRVNENVRSERRLFFLLINIISSSHFVLLYSLSFFHFPFPIFYFLFPIFYFPFSFSIDRVDLFSINPD